MTPFDFVKSINSGTNLYTADDANEALLDKSYVPFIINKALSFHVDTILYADEMNRAYDLTPKEQYWYFISSCKSRRRYGKWVKAEQNDDLELVQKVYRVNRKNAKTILSLLTSVHLNELRTKTQVSNE